MQFSEQWILKSSIPYSTEFLKTTLQTLKRTFSEKEGSVAHKKLKVGIDGSAISLSKQKTIWFFETQVNLTGGFRDWNIWYSINLTIDLLLSFYKATNGAKFFYIEGICWIM